MYNSSNKSKGYMPVSSGPNMTGFDMGKTSSMMDMMQEGGLTPMSSYQRSFTRPRTRGAALLARALQKQKDLSLLEDYERAEAERQRKGGLFGSILGTGLGLVGGALGLGPAGVALGTGLGKSIGESFGAGDAEFVDTRGTVYNQDLFRDVADAGKEFDEGRFNRALSSGLKAGLTAGLTPGGGIYGQYNPLTSSGIENIGKGIMGEGVIGYGGTQGLFSFADPQYMELADDVANVSQSSNLFPSFRQAIGDSLTGGSGLGSLFQFGGGREQLGYVPFGRNAGLSLGSFEDGGLIGMQTGGLTAEGILRGQGLVADDTQLGLFQAFDPTAIGRARETTGQSLLGMTGGQ